MDAPPCRVLETAQPILTPAQTTHPLFAELDEIYCQAETEVALRHNRLSPAGVQKKNS